MFSPILAMSSRRRSATVSPLRPGNATAPRASTSVGAAASAAAATSWANVWNSSPLATKSVSLLTSAIATAAPSGDVSRVTTPSAATRPARLSALAAPDLRINSTATSMSPPASTSAFLQSIMPAPVRSRSSRTSAALISIGIGLAIRAGGNPPADVESDPAGPSGPRASVNPLRRLPRPGLRQSNPTPPRLLPRHARAGAPPGGAGPAAVRRRRPPPRACPSERPGPARARR